VQKKIRKINRNLLLDLSVAQMKMFFQHRTDLTAFLPTQNFKKQYLFFFHKNTLQLVGWFFLSSKHLPICWGRGGGGYF
jgi:hypothetical protein